MKEGLLAEREGRFVPNFTVSGISVPLDFSVYDLASDIAMEMENVDEAMQIAGRMSKILSK